jgi:hypothetical protein
VRKGIKKGKENDVFVTKLRLHKACFNILCRLPYSVYYSRELDQGPRTRHLNVVIDFSTLLTHIVHVSWQLPIWGVKSYLDFTQFRDIWGPAVWGVVDFRDQYRGANVTVFDFLTGLTQLVEAHCYWVLCRNVCALYSQMNTCQPRQGMLH